MTDPRPRVRARGRRCVSLVALCVLFGVAPAGRADATPTDGGIAPGQVAAPGAVLWDPADDRILWGRDARRPRPMASTTKIMTAMLAVESGSLDDTVTISRRAARVGAIPGGASLGLDEGQRLPMRELLAGLMLRSGNDGAVAVAEHVAGSEDAFVARMNSRAAELGLVDTQFLNASGLTDDPRHHASPVDLAKLAEVALDQPSIAAWAAAPVWDTGTFGVIENRNELLTDYAGANGLKTGYTALAGRCLVASAGRRGRHLISVVLGSEDHFADSAVVLDHGFEDFLRVEVTPGERIGTWRTSAGAVEITTAAPLARTVAASAEVEVHLDQIPGKAPGIAAGDEVGTVDVVIDDQTRLTSAAVAAAGLEAGPAGLGETMQDGLRGLARLMVTPDGATPAVASSPARIEGPQGGT